MERTEYFSPPLGERVFYPWYSVQTVLTVFVDPTGLFQGSEQEVTDVQIVDARAVVLPVGISFVGKNSIKITYTAPDQVDPEDIITLRAPDVATANASRIPSLIELADPTVGQFFGDRRNEAIALKVLCMIAGDGATSTAVSTGVSKIKEGDVEVDYEVDAGIVGAWCAEFRWIARAMAARAASRTC